MQVLVYCLMLQNVAMASVDEVVLAPVRPPRAADSKSKGKAPNKIFGIPESAFMDCYRNIKDDHQLSIAYNILLNDSSIQKIYAVNFRDDAIPYQLFKMALTHFQKSEFSRVVLNYVSANRSKAILEDGFENLKTMVFKDDLPEILVEVLINEDALLQDLEVLNGAFYAKILHIAPLKRQFYNALHVIKKKNPEFNEKITALKTSIAASMLDQQELSFNQVCMAIYHEDEFELAEIYLKLHKTGNCYNSKLIFEECSSNGTSVDFKFLLRLFTSVQNVSSLSSCKSMLQLARKYYFYFIWEPENTAGGEFYELLSYVLKSGIFAHRGKVDIDLGIYYFFERLMCALKYKIVKHDEKLSFQVSTLKRISRIRKSFKVVSKLDIFYITKNYNLLAEIFPEIDIVMKDQRTMKEFCKKYNCLEIFDTKIDVPAYEKRKSLPSN